MAQSFYDLFAQGPDPEERAAMERIRLLTPAQRTALEGELGQQQAVQGVEGLGRMALGLPQSPYADRKAAGDELRALAAKMRPGTAEFYEAAIPILQKYNLPAEAAQMEEQRLKLETGKAEMSPVLKLQRAKDLLMKRPDASSPAVQASIAALDRELAEHGKSKTAGGGADPEFIKLLNAYEAAVAAGQGDRAAMIKLALDAWIKSKESSGQDVAWARLALAQLVEARKEKKDERKATQEDAAIVSALQGTIRAVDNEIHSAQSLLAHKGLPRIVGPRAGAVPVSGLGFAFGEDAAGAGAYYLTLEGQLFIRALQDLKATSKTGASGLGQLTEVEGNKIQAAKAALTRQQGEAQFRDTLARYLSLLQDTRAVAGKELTGVGADIPVYTPSPAAPSKPAPRAVPAPAAAPAKRTFKATKVN